ncbi:MAG: hypothetical protein GYB68_01685 [Chloroflexi bacterium]|nr:hypothetical protein [Chloroflexota bacterium]
MKRYIILPLIILAAALTVGCTETFVNNVESFNERATQIASGGGVAPNPGDAQTDPGSGGGDAADQPAENIENLRDLTGDPSLLLVTAWGQTTSLPTGSTFTIRATEAQVATYIVSRLQQGGFQNTILGGVASIGLGQIRLDLRVQGDERAGTVIVTFQPTLTPGGVVQLNPRGSDLGDLNVPSDLLPGIGDAVLGALTGAVSPSQVRVNLTAVSLDNQRLEVSGSVR